MQSITGKQLFRKLGILNKCFINSPAAAKARVYYQLNLSQDNQVVVFRCGIIDKTVMYEAETGRWYEKCYMGKVSAPSFHHNFRC